MNASQKKNSKGKKYGKIFLGLFFCAVIAAGCGKDGTGSKGQTGGIAYVSETKEIDLRNIDSMLERDGSLYGIRNEYQDTTGEAVRSLVKIDVLTGSLETTPLSIWGGEESIAGFTWNEKGNFVFLTTLWQEEGPSYSLYEVSPEGKKLDGKALTSLIEEDQYLQSMTGDGLGNYYLMVSDQMGESLILVMDSQGTVQNTIKSTSYVDGLICGDSGSVYASVWEDTGLVLKKVNVAEGKMGEAIPLSNISMMGTLLTASGGPTGVLLGNDKGIFTCELETGQCNQILNWLDSGVNAYDMMQFGTTGEGAYWALNRNPDPDAGAGGEISEKLEFMVLNPVAADQLPKKEVLTYGTAYLGYEARAGIVRFNKTNPKYKIEVIEYMEGDWLKWEESLARMNAELAGNNCPDIIDLSGGVDFEQAVSKGIFADLSPYMEKSGTFQMEDYQENIFNIYSREGKLYGIVPRFVLSALVGSAEKLKNIERWNLEELLAFTKQYPDAKLLDGVSDLILWMLTSTNMDKYMDWETGKCFFDQKDFISVLEYANTFEKEIDYQNENRIGTHEGIQSGKYLMMNHYFYQVRDIQVMKGMFDGPVKIVGFPVDEGNGICVSPNLGMGMSQRSKNKEGVWEFMSYFLGDEYQNRTEGNFNYGLPVKKSAIDLFCNRAMEQLYTTDENGNRIEQTSSHGYDDLSVTIRAATKEEVDQFKDIINRADTMLSESTQMDKIIKEEVGGYFSGQKTVEEVVKIIQNRMQVYMNENR